MDSTEGKIIFHGRIAGMQEVGTGFNGEMTGRENIYMNGGILDILPRVNYESLFNN